MLLCRQINREQAKELISPGHKPHGNLMSITRFALLQTKCRTSAARFVKRRGNFLATKRTSSCGYSEKNMPVHLHNCKQFDADKRNDSYTVTCTSDLTQLTGFYVPALKAHINNDESIDFESGVSCM